MPGLVHEFLRQATGGQLRIRLESSDIEAIRSLQEREAGRQWRRALGGALVVSGALIAGLQAGPWLVAGWSLPGLALFALGGWFFWRARR